MEMKKDLSTKLLMEYPDVFADVENVCLFHGRQVIEPENLELLPQEILYKEADGTLREKRGDVRMRLKDNGIELAVLHLENQSDISNVMPIRDMGYIYSGYQEQLRIRKKQNRKQGIHYVSGEIGLDQKLCPVISLILYYGTEEWTAPTRLKEMLIIPQDGNNDWEPLIEDHKIHLVNLICQSDEEVDQYRSDLWYIVKCLKCGKDRHRYRRFLEEETKRTMRHPEAVIDMIAAFAGRDEASQMAEKIIREKRQEGERCTMYTILDYLEEEGLQKGLNRGREEGRKQGREEGINQIYYRMFENNRTPEDISDFTGESLEFLYEVQEKYRTEIREKSKYGSAADEQKTEL